MTKPLPTFTTDPSTPTFSLKDAVEYLELALAEAAFAAKHVAAALQTAVTPQGSGSVSISPRRQLSLVHRFPSAELELLCIELDAGPATCTALCDFGRRARLVEHLHPSQHRQTRRYVRKLAAASARLGFHLRGLRRRDVIDGISVVPAPSLASRDRSAVDSSPITEPEPVTLRSAGVPANDASAEHGEEPARDLPFVRALARDLAVVVAGGDVKRDVVRRLACEAEIDLESIAIAKGQKRPAGVLAKRIKDGHVGALVIIEGLMSHAAYAVLISASRHADLPVAHAGRGGLAKVRQGLVELERQLRGRAGKPLSAA